MTIATLHPVLVHGRTAWDLGELPRDEYETRHSLVRAALAFHGCRVCVVLGSRTLYANLAYLTGCRPDDIPSVALVHRDHDTVLFAGLGGARDLHHLQETNYVDDIRYYPTPGQGVRTVLREWGEMEGTVGVVGAATDVPLEMAANVKRGLDGFALVSLDEVFFQIRRRKRPRERILLERAAEIVASARDAAVTEFIATGIPHKAATVAERTARVLGARDVRTLANVGEGPELRPIMEPSSSVAARLALHIGLERAGYWAETTVTFPRQVGGRAAAKAIAEMRSALRPGAALSRVAEAGLSKLACDGQRALALDIGLGQGLGLGSEEELRVSPDSRELLEGGEILSLRCVVTDEKGAWSADATIVEITDLGARTVLPSWWM